MSNHTQLATAEHSAYTEEQRRLITDVLCKGASETEVEFFMEVAKRARLDPFRKQIHAVKRWDSKIGREAMTFQVGIDGLRAIASRTGEYAGNDDVVFEVDEGGQPTKATATVWRLVKGNRIAFTASVFWDECVQTMKGGAPNSMWQKRPFGQLGKCAEAAALRKAFPEEGSGLYIEEEIHDEPQAQAAPAAARVTMPKAPTAPAEEAERAQAAPAAAIDAEVLPPPADRPAAGDDITAEQGALLDFLNAVSEMEQPEQINKAVSEYTAFANEEHRKKARRTVAVRANQLGFVWNKQTSQYVRP